MSAQGHAQKSSSLEVSLARDLSVLLGNEIAPIFKRARGADGSTDFQGAFGNAVNQYGSGLHDEGEQPLPPKYTSLSNIVPVGVQLDKHCHPAAGGAAMAPRGGLPPSALPGRQRHLERPKQGSQQRGPGRPEADRAAAATAAAAGSPSPSKRRAASEPQPEPSFGRPASAAAGPVARGGVPAMAGVKKQFKFKVKLNGRVVGSAGGGPSPSPPREAPLGADAIVDAVCGFGAAQLLSPIPAHWTRIVDGSLEPSVVPAPRAALQPPACRAAGPAQEQQRQEQQRWQHGPPGKGTPPPEGEESECDAVDVLVRPAASPSNSPFAAAEVQRAPQHMWPSSSQQAQQPSGDARPAAAEPGHASAQPARAKPSPDAAAAAQQSVLSPLPSLWGRVSESPAVPPPAAPAPSRLAQQAPRPPTQQTAQQQQEQQQQQPAVGPRPRAAKRGSDSGDGTEAAPAPKRHRSASAEPSGDRRGGDAAAGPASGPAGRGQVSCELPTPSPVEHPQQPQQLASATGAAAEQVGLPAKRPSSVPLIPKLEAAVASRQPTPVPSRSPPGNKQQPQLASQQQQQQQPASTEPGNDSPLGAVAWPLQGVLQAMAEQANQAPSSTVCMQLQDEGRRLKRFAEKKMAGERHTHVSCTFLLSSGLKFLAAAGVMEALPHKYSRDSTSVMYSQTAAMLESCAHVALRADGPALATLGMALLAERLGVVARLRAAHCMRNEMNRDVAAFRTAVESARGETFQRPSPTDSNVSATMALPLEGGSPGESQQQQGGGGGKKPQQQQGGSGSHSAANSPASARGAGAGTKGSAGSCVPAPGRVEEAGNAPQLLGLPRAIVDRELQIANTMQAVTSALSALGRSSERLRDYMGKAAAEDNVHALRAAAGAALLSADAGMGRLEPMLNIAREALDSAMKIEA